MATKKGRKGGKAKEVITRVWLTPVGQPYSTVEHLKMITSKKLPDNKDEKPSSLRWR